MLSGELEILEAPLDGVETPLDRVETPPVGDDPSAGDWNVPASATEEMPPPIISADQTGHGPAISVEPEIPDVASVGDDLSTGDWAIPPAPSVEISAPTILDHGAVEPPPTAPASGARRPPQPQFFGLLSSLGGLGFVGGGSVNLDHFVGGMPITLPDLPPTPPGFGKIRIDMGGAPSAISPLIAPPPQPAPPPPAPPVSPPPPRVSTPVAREAPPAAPEAPPKEPIPAASPPVSSPQPPVSFAPRPPPKPPFATDVYHPAAEDSPNPLAPSGSPGPSMAFDGLAMVGVPDADVFSNAGVNPMAINDAAFGGSAMSQPDEIPIPDSPERAKRAAENPERDFAEDEFWDRTDEQEDAAPAATQPAARRPETPQPPAVPDDDLNDLPEEEPGDTQTDARIPPHPTPETEPPPKRGDSAFPFSCRSYWWGSSSPSRRSGASSPSNPRSTEQ